MRPVVRREGTPERADMPALFACSAALPNPQVLADLYSDAPAFAAHTDLRAVALLRWTSPEAGVEVSVAR